MATIIIIHQTIVASATRVVQPSSLDGSECSYAWEVSIND